MNKIPSYPRFKYVMEMVYKFIEDNNINFYPFDIIKLIEKNKWRINKYSELEKVYNYTNKEVCRMLQSNDAKTILEKGNKDLYVIIYNDDLNVNIWERIRFSLAHEIGHIYLGHLEDFEETEIHRKGISPKWYDVLEREADMFARNILCPYPVLKNTIKNFNIDNFNLQIINEIFNISRQAAEIRLKTLNQDSNYSFKYTIKNIKALGNIYCETCGSITFDTASICTICGNHNEYTIKDFIYFTEEEEVMNYNYYEYNQCNNCENENIIENSNFCHICGTDLRNLCTNKNCENNNSSLPYNARYCNLCGSKSKFYNNQLLPDWKTERDLSNDDLLDCTTLDDDNLPF